MILQNEGQQAKWHVNGWQQHGNGYDDGKVYGLWFHLTVSSWILKVMSVFLQRDSGCQTGSGSYQSGSYEGESLVDQ